MNAASASARLVLPYIDLTVTPGEYRDALDDLPKLVNRGHYESLAEGVGSLLDR